MLWSKAFELYNKTKEDFIIEYVVKRQDDSLLNIPFADKIKLMKNDGIYVDEMFNNIQIEQYNNILIFQGDLYDGEKKLIIDTEEDKIILSTLRKINYIDDREYEDIIVTEKVQGVTECYRYYNGDVYNDNGVIVEDKIITDIIKDYPNHVFIFRNKKRSEKDIREGLFLVGIKNIIDGYEYEYSMVKSLADNYGIPCARRYFLFTIDDVIEYSNENDIDFVVSMESIKLQTTRQ